MKTTELESADAGDGFSAAMKAQGVDIRATESPAPSTPADAGTAGEAIGVVPIRGVTLPKVKTTNKSGNGGTTGVIGRTGPSTSASQDDTSAHCSNSDEPASDEEQTVPHFFKQELATLLDESTGDLVALEEFDRAVDDRALENEWIGRHTDLSLAAIKAEHLRKGRYTAHVDGAGILLGDPEEYRLAVEIGVQITLCVHRGRTEDQRLEFVLRSQAGKRILTYDEQRELTNRLIVVQLRLGVDYKTIAKMTGVHPNTARNVEKRAAAEPNSNHGITQRPDGRFNQSTREKIAKAHRLRAKGKNNSEIASIFNETTETVGRWFKDPAAQGKTKDKKKHGKTPKTNRVTSASQMTDMTETIAANDGIPEIDRLGLERSQQDVQAYVTWFEAASAKAREAVKAAGDSVEELLRLSLYGNQLKAATDIRLRKILFAGGEVAVEESPSSDSYTDRARAVAAPVFLGIPMEITPEEVFVTLVNGSGGVIDNRDNVLVCKEQPVRGKAARFRGKCFNSKLGLRAFQLLGRQTFSHAECASAFGPRLDNLRSPDTELAGLKAGPKEKEVI